MFLSAVGTEFIVAFIVIIAVQYAVAVFCLLKLAYLDISKREYVLWNIFILIVFFIGDIAFLVYYYKVGKNKRIPEPTEDVEDEAAEASKEHVGEAEAAETEHDDSGAPIEDNDGTETPKE